LPRFRGELWAWDQGIWSEGILLSCGHSFVRPPAEPFFYPGRHEGAAVARSGGQGRPTWGRPKGLSLTEAPPRLLHSATQFHPFSTLPWDDQYPLHHRAIDQSLREGNQIP
jgi:hypothetical protein